MLHLLHAALLVAPQVPAGPPVGPARLADGSERPAAAVPLLTAPRENEWGIDLDGLLDEEVWSQAAVLDGFVEVEPREGIPGEPRTEVLLWRTDTHLYLGFRCFEPEPERMVLQNQHRDAFLNEDDRVEFILDTYGSGKTAYFFQLSAAGSRGDALIGGSGSRFNKQWDTFWEARTRVHSDRWTAEVVIPFRSMASGSSGVWRANFERQRGATRQEFRWSGASRGLRLFNPLHAGLLTGITDVDHGNGVTLRPFAKARRIEPRGESADWDTGFGGDLEWWITSQLKLSLTVNTDFAETEVDARRINLSQYSLFFPEKRDFFLEDANLFEFGPRGSNLVPFYSRRIGLVDGEEVDVESGARLSGRAGPWDLGILAVRTGAENFDGDEVPEGELFVLRPSYNLDEHFAVGGLLTYGDPADDDRNAVTGLDLRYTGDAAGGQFDWNSYVLRSADESESTRGSVAGSRAAISASDWGWSGEVLLTQGDFGPGLGFVRRPGQSNANTGFSWSPRPADPGSAIRKYSYGLSLSGWFEDAAELMSHGVTATLFGVEWHSGDEIELQARYNGDRVVDADFDPGGVPVSPDYYDWSEFVVDFESSETRALAIDANLRSGTWYDGTRTRLGTELNWRPSPMMAWSLDYTETQADLDNGDFAARVIGLGANFYANPWLSWQNIVQADNESEELGWQSRLRWIHRDGQELFLVANLGWVQRVDDVIVPTDRDFALKLVYSVRL